MDRTLLVLLAEAWKTGERADVLALVDRIKEAPPEEAAETFLALRQTVKAARALADLPVRLAEALAPAVAIRTDAIPLMRANQSEARSARKRRNIALFLLASSSRPACQG